ncbi:choice-of-anchor Q domain-containing protein [Crocosphaera sp. Alani8]|uniref:choice-of-anchor Q domain-containing protein n=1 Tax=Crocosphaera sp. Alani8 TaxID=3038952 RepID=UPI00313BF2E4
MAFFNVINLTDRGPGSLRHAINMANSNPGADTINFDVSGTIELTSKELLITDAVTINGLGVNSLKVDAQRNGFRVFKIDDGDKENQLDVFIRGLTITGGNSVGGGGGILSLENLTIQDSMISGNTSTGIQGQYDTILIDGGGINSLYSNLTIINTQITNNEVIGQLTDGQFANSSHNYGDDPDGGGVSIRNGQLEIIDSTISGNQVTGGLTDGGGVYSWKSDVKVANSTISGNTVEGTLLGSGGGIYNRYGDTIIENSTIANNSTYMTDDFGSGDGGGIFSRHGNLTVTNSTISGNIAVGLNRTDGGGIYSRNGNLTVANSTISYNSTTGIGADGGGIFSSNGTATLTNSTLSHNSADGSGGGLFSGGKTKLSNTIIANSNGLDCVLNNRKINLKFNNLIEDGSCLSSLSGDPGLGPLQNNGGFTKTHALLDGSITIDGGDNSQAQAVGLLFDQRGSAFERIVNGTVDIGAYEMQSKSIIDSSSFDFTDQILLSNEFFNLSLNTAFKDMQLKDALTYSVTLTNGDSLPSWLTFDGTQVTGTPTIDDVGNLSLMIIANDDRGNSVSDVLTLNIFNSLTETNHTLAEADTITLNHRVQTIILDHAYKNPVIFASSVSFNGKQLASPRITNVTDNSFDIYLQEPSNEDGTHTSESLSYFVFEAGNYQLSDGTLLEVGIFNTDATTNTSDRTLTPWQTVEFDIDFAETPVIFSQVQTDNESDLVRTRQQNATSKGFEVVMEEDEIKARNGEGHSDETIGYLAIASGSGTSNEVTYQAGSTSDSVTHEFSSLTFGEEFSNIPHFLASIATYDGPDPSALRFQNLTTHGVQVTLQEDTTFDDETNHTTEVVNYLAIEGDNGLQGTAYDPLTGNRVIVGTDSNDYILGLAQNDTRTGRGGSDVFVLETNQGTDTLTDFELGVDKIGLADSLSFGALTLTDIDNDTSVIFDNQELAILKGIQSTQLTNDHFVEVTL